MPSRQQRARTRTQSAPVLSAGTGARLPGRLAGQLTYACLCPGVLTHATLQMRMSSRCECVRAKILFRPATRAPSATGKRVRTHTVTRTHTRVCAWVNRWQPCRETETFGLTGAEVVHRGWWYASASRALVSRPRAPAW